jgi:glucokinase
MKYVLGIDIGGTNTTAALVECDGRGEIFAETTIATDADDAPQVIVQRIADAAKPLVDDAPASLCGVGVGCPGLIDPLTGGVLKSPNLPSLVGFGLRDKLAELLQLPVSVQNDANAAALGEYMFSNEEGIQNLILLTLGTGVGGGVITDGRLLLGADNAAAELGHVKIRPGGERCGCGRLGCLEAYVGSAGIARTAQEELAEAKGDSQLSGKQITTKEINEAADDGDRAAQQILFRTGQDLGRGIAQMIDMFNPEKVVLAGRASAALEHLRPGIKDGLQEFASFEESRDRVDIDRVGRLEEINVLGAAATFLNAQSGDRKSPPTVRVADDRLVISAHIGAQSCHVGILQANGRILESDEITESRKDRAKRTYEELLEETVKIVGDVLSRLKANGVEASRICGGGVVVPVPVEELISGRLGRAPALPNLQNQMLGYDLHHRLSLHAGLEIPFIVENDATGAALAELMFGVAQGHKNFVDVHLCTGVGGCITFDGKLYRGVNNYAGEAGHICVQPEGEKCLCGSKGCLETVASGRALVEIAKKRKLAIARQHGEQLHYSHLVQAAESGDKKVLNLFTEMGKYLGIAVASCINLLNPSLVVFSGQLAGGYRFFEPAMKDELSLRVFAGVPYDVKCADCLQNSEIRSALAAYLYHSRI